MHAREDHHPAEHCVQRRHEQVAPVGQPFCIDDLDGLAINGERLAVEHFGDDDIGQRLRAILLELRTPDGEFLFHAGVDGGHRLRCGDHPCVGEGGLDRLEAEVIVRVGLADIDGGEPLAGSLDRVRYGSAVWESEAAVDQKASEAPVMSTGARKKPFSPAEMCFQESPPAAWPSPAGAKTAAAPRRGSFS